MPSPNVPIMYEHREWADTEVSTGRQLTVSAITLGLTVLVTVIVWFVSDASTRAWSSSGWMETGVLACMAAPIAMLFAWREIDLSLLGTSAVGALVAVEVDSIPAALATGFAVGAAIGAVIGVIRWLVAAPSAVVSLLAGWTVQQLSNDQIGTRGGQVSGRVTSGPALLVALVVVAAAVGVWFLHPRRSGMRSGHPHPSVIVGFALSGAAGTVGGVLLAKYLQYGQIGVGSAFSVLAVATIGVAGLLFGAGWYAPILATIAAPVLVALQLAFVSSDRSLFQKELLVGALALIGLVIAWGFHRLSEDEAPSPLPRHGWEPAIQPQPSPPWGSDEVPAPPPPSRTAQTDHR